MDSTAVLSADGLVRLGAFLYALGLSAFLAEYTVSVDGRLLAFVFFGGMCCSFLYTAGPYGLKYIGLGDVVVMLTFGPLSVLYSFLCQVSFLLCVYNEHCEDKKKSIFFVRMGAI